MAQTLTVGAIVVATTCLLLAAKPSLRSLHLSTFLLHNLRPTVNRLKDTCQDGLHPFPTMRIFYLVNFRLEVGNPLRQIAVCSRRCIRTCFSQAHLLLVGRFSQGTHILEEVRHHRALLAGPRTSVADMSCAIGWPRLRAMMRSAWRTMMRTQFFQARTERKKFRHGSFHQKFGPVELCELFPLKTFSDTKLGGVKLLGMFRGWTSGRLEVVETHKNLPG